MEVLITKSFYCNVKKKAMYTGQEADYSEEDANYRVNKIKVAKFKELKNQFETKEEKSTKKTKKK